MLVPIASRSCKPCRESYYLPIISASHTHLTVYASSSTPADYHLRMMLLAHKSIAQEHVCQITAWQILKIGDHYTWNLKCNLCFNLLIRELAAKKVKKTLTNIIKSNLRSINSSLQNWAVFSWKIHEEMWKKNTWNIFR